MASSLETFLLAIVLPGTELPETKNLHPLAYYSDHFELPLPEGHRFPMAKYGLLRQRVLEERLLPPQALRVPAAVSDAEILRAHTAEYLKQLLDGSLPTAAVRRIGFPWSAGLIERSRRSAGGTLAACRSALARGVGVNLAGGTHHAFADRGEGFCVLNDAAIALRALKAEGEIGRALVVDLDVHQGNGTAVIFQGDPTVFTFSVHGRRNFPFRKEESDLDLALEDGTEDEEYLAALATGLEQAFAAARAELVIYLAGADPYAGDRLGRLALTKAGLAARDSKVFDACRVAGLPVAVAMAGGYAEELADIVDIHLETVSQALQLG